MQEPTFDRIILHETYKKEVLSIGVDIYVTVKGSSFFTGQTAIKKAKEVAQLVDSLISAGLPPENVYVTSVSLQTESGLLSKSSAAVYVLKFHCLNLEQLPDLLGAIASSKNASMDRLEWRYPDDEEFQTQWTEESLASLRRKAERMAQALGVKIVGVANCRIGDTPPPRRQEAFEPSLETMPGMRRRASIDLGVPMAQTTVLQLHISVEFRVSS